MDAVAFHSNQADRWESQYQAPVFSQRISVLSKLIANPSGHWLDAGCGTGTIARWLADRGCSVTAIDASEQMIQNCHSHPSVTYKVGSVTAIPLPAACLDGIVCSSVLEYLDSPCKALAEFSRILKPRGTLLVSVPNRETRLKLWIAYWLTRYLPNRRVFTFLDHSKHSYTRRSFATLLHDFAVEQVQAFGGEPVRLPVYRITIHPRNTLLMFKAQAL